MSIKLVGTAPPGNFVCDGCTASPDGWWGEACKRHDFEYNRGRLLRLGLKAAKSSAEFFGGKENYNHVRQLRAELRYHRHKADFRFRENVWRLSQGSFRRRVGGWFVAQVYYRAVRRFGWLAMRGWAKDWGSWEE